MIKDDDALMKFPFERLMISQALVSHSLSFSFLFHVMQLTISNKICILLHERKVSVSHLHCIWPCLSSEQMIRTSALFRNVYWDTFCAWIPVPNIYLASTGRYWFGWFDFFG